MGAGAHESGCTGHHGEFVGMASDVLSVKMNLRPPRASYQMNVKPRPRLLGLLASTLALAITACAHQAASVDGTWPSNRIDRAFVKVMRSHHRAALEIARIATDRGEHPQIRRLAQAIVSTRRAEIRQLERLELELKRARVARGKLGIPRRKRGIEANVRLLRIAEPFDRAFIDSLIAHNQVAIRMASVELANGLNSNVKELAQAIVDAQATEIDRLNTWRVDWFGELSPSGGVPSEGATIRRDG